MDDELTPKNQVEELKPSDTYEHIKGRPFRIAPCKGYEDRLTILQSPCQFLQLPTMPLLARFSLSDINISDRELRCTHTREAIRLAYIINKHQS
jgi:hypothetical protein